MTADWVLIACLKQLFTEFDRLAPGRAHASDGSIGDVAHQREVSDHNPDETGSVPIHDADHVNEVHAADVDSNLRTPGLTMEDVVQFLLGRCRSGAEKRLRYIIFNRRIWQAKNGWRQEVYTGPSPHTEHAHFSASYDTDLEASTASWHLEDITMALTDQDKHDIIEGVWAHLLDVNVVPGQKPNPQPAGGILRYSSSEHHAIFDQASAAVRGLAVRGDNVDEQAIVAGVLAGLAPAIAEQVAALLAARLAA